MTYGVLQANPSTLFNKIMGNSFMASFMNTNVFYEMIDNFDLLDSQYEVLQGRWPQNYDELVIVLQDPSQITDYMTYTLGLRDPKELDELMNTVMSGKEAESVVDFSQWTYEDLMNLRFRLVDASNLYRYNEEYAVWEDMSDNEDYLKEQIAGGEQLKVVGIVCGREGANATALQAGVAYTSGLTRHVIASASESEIVASQLQDENIDVFSGAPFNEKKDTELNFQDMITVDSAAISSSFGMNISGDGIMNLLNKFLNDNLGSMTVDTGAAQKAFKDTFAQLATRMLQQYVQAQGGGAVKLHLKDAQAIVDAYMASEDAAAIIQNLADQYNVSAQIFTEPCRQLLVGLIGDVVARELAGPGAELPEETEPGETTPEETEAFAPDATEAPVPEVTEAPAPEVTEAPTPEVTAPPATEPIASAATPAAETQPAATEGSDVQVQIDTGMIYATISAEQIEGFVASYTECALVNGVASVLSTQMMQPVIQQMLSSKINEFGTVLSRYIGSSFYVNTERLASAFQFNMNEEELQRLMAAMSGQSRESSALGNLQSLGYARLEVPTAMSIYLRDFETKEEFMAFLDDYNDRMAAEGQEDSVIRYTDMTGMMMSSVRTIIDSVSYALIAFVAVSLVVSSIMIGIITYISVMERTKEIGVLRAIGASKRNISQVFNAETFIIGLCSGLIGIGVTLLLLIPGNALIQHLTDNPDIVAQLPVQNGVILVILSMVLTLIGGFIPAKQAAKKDPVIALRSE